MKSGIRRSGFALFAFAVTLLASSAFALPVVYEGTLSSGISATGTVTGGSWSKINGDEVDYWAFHAVAGDVVTIRVDRLDSGLDPVFSFYMGTTNVDTSLYNNGGSWGGLAFLDIADDENPPATGTGPFGDPELTTDPLAEKSLYTVIVGGFAFGSVDNNANYHYRITVTNNTPEPMTLALFGIGLAGLGFARRRSAGKAM